MKIRIEKRILAGLLAFTTIAFAVMYMPKTVRAEDITDSVVKYQEVSNATFLQHIGSTAPACTLGDADNTGYLFAGWYEKNSDGTVGEPIATKDGVTGSVYAKFVPSYLTGVACQVDINANSTMRNLRVVSLVDSEDYAAVGFNVYGRYDKDNNGTNECEWEMYSYSEDGSNEAESKSVYRGLYEYSADGTSKTLKTPQDVFGADAEGFYFTTVSITGIGEKTSATTGVTIDFRDATMAVQPYWITLDGTYVEGMGEFNRVNDYEAGIVNVSVNLKEATAIAAGMLSVECPSGYTYVEAECGRVFEEMSFKQEGNIIECVGNMAIGAATENTTNPNEVFVNFRLTKIDSTLAAGESEFVVTVLDNGFCNYKEVFDTSVKAWNIKY